MCVDVGEGERKKLTKKGKEKMNSGQVADTHTLVVYAVYVRKVPKIKKQNNFYNFSLSYKLFRGEEKTLLKTYRVTCIWLCGAAACVRCYCLI